MLRFNYRLVPADQNQKQVVTIVPNSFDGDIVVLQLGNAVVNIHAKDLAEEVAAVIKQQEEDKQKNQEESTKAENSELPKA